MKPAGQSGLAKLEISVGIHDLLEQSISRSQLYSGASNDSSAASAAPQSHTNSRQGRSNKLSPTAQDKRSKITLLSPASQVAGTASTPSWKREPRLSDTECTVVPERRQLDDSGLNNNGGKATGHSKPGNRPSLTQVPFYESRPSILTYMFYMLVSQ